MLEKNSREKNTRKQNTLALRQRMLLLLTAVVLGGLVGTWWLPQSSAPLFGIPKIVLALAAVFFCLGGLPLLGYYYLFAQWSAEVDKENSL